MNEYELKLSLFVFSSGVCGPPWPKETGVHFNGWAQCEFQIELFQQEHTKVWRISTCCCGELWTPHVTQCCQRWLFHVASRETAESHAHIIPYVSARREDYTAITKSTVFPLSFCGHRWLENQPVIERALEVWPSLTQYMDAVRRKQLPNPGTASFDSAGSHEWYSHHRQVTLLLDCCQAFQSLFEEVSNRWASDAFPQQWPGWVDQGSDLYVHYQQRTIATTD